MKKQTDILIVGGGFGGVAVAQQLEKNGFNVTLVDRKDYFEVTFAVLRNVADPKLLGDTPRKLYRDFIKGQLVQGSVVSMGDKEARLDSGDVIQFKQAVLASGSRYPTLPLAKTESAFQYAQRHQEIAQEHQSLADAKSVLVIGGGAVGVEFAGEIAAAFPNKEIILAHAGDRLLADLKPKAQRKAFEQLTDKGVTVKLNRRFEKQGSSYTCVKSGETIQADKVYVCVGMIPNTDFLKAELSDALNSTGHVMVDEFMKVKGHDSLYALGDCSDLDTHKHGYLASVQGKMVADAIIKAAKGKKAKSYKTPPLAVVTPIGRDSGVAQMPFGVTTMNFFVNLKQKDMGISNMYKVFGSTPDKRPA